MGEDDRRRGKVGRAVWNNNGGSQQSRYLDEPIVLAKDVAQVFYVKDMTSKPRKRKDKKTNTSCDEPKRHIVLSGKRNIVGVEDKTDMSQDYNQFGEILPFRVNTDTSIKLNDEDAP
jgi:hypothetical protein